MGIPEVSIDKDFLNIFRHIVKDEKININDSVMNTFCLKVNAKEFDYNLLIEDLVDNLIAYCIAPKRYEEAYRKRKVGALSKEARAMFREHSNNDGELGELILFSLLESHLEAPKILSKMKLKTSSNDYVKRADGIHVLKITETDYELIFGESKLYDDLTKGITEAIKSVHELKTRKENNIQDEISLISNNIDSEFMKENYEFIKRILIPRRDDELEYDIAFGVFVGFEIDLQIITNGMNNIDARKAIYEVVEMQCKNKVKHIKKKIEEYNLENHNFYIYLMPFTNIDKNRKEIIKQITS